MARHSTLQAPPQYTSGEWRRTSSGVATNNPYFDGYSTGTPISGVSSAQGVSSSSGITAGSGFVPSALGSGYSLDSLVSMMQNIQAQNNAWSAEQAQKQMDFQSASADKAMKFNADQADLSRQWQEMMSNTAHQREIKDLQAAGLNPVLSAMGGNGAPVTSGATASGYASDGAKGDTDTSLAPALVSLFGSIMSSQTALANTAVSAATQSAVADKYTAMSKYVSELQSQTTLTSANISAMASKYVAETHAGASMYGADTAAQASKVAASIHAAAQKYGYDLSALTQKEIASFNAEVNKQLKSMDLQHDFDIREAYPSNLFQLGSSLFGSLSDSGAGLSGLSSIFDVLQGEGLNLNLFDALRRGFVGNGSSYGGGGGRGGR
ncbi:DNA pilot protein [Dipodfec virus RodF1_52]|uniref:DNA pilot protein n=1 Tax=Dipodfec virus RodF1_52 TaxID=2929301 RepID=A0A976R8D9_9VIRU|nr:DNA pilot protein [Dipodfec virus RodF1_52]